MGKKHLKASILNRKLHRWGAILTALPLLVVIASGLLLQFKKESAWIQPPTQQGSAWSPDTRMDDILKAAAAAEEAQIKTWEDVDRLDIRPSKKVIKVRAKNAWEVQLDAKSLAILQTNYRRSDLIESIHDGSYFGLKLSVFLGTGIVLLGLWFTGIYLFFLPYLVRRNRNRPKGS